MEQKSDEWFAGRINRITASRAGPILGVSPYSTPDDVMRVMVRDHFGAEREFLGNFATDYGEKHEKDAILALESDLSVMVEKCGLIVHPDHDWLAASPDGLAGKGAVVEVKCPYNQNLFSISDRPDYYAQIQIQMACADRVTGLFFVWTPPDPESLEPRTSREFVCRNEEWFDENLPKLKAFHDRYLEIIADEELAKPYLDDLVQDMTDDEEWIDVAVNYQDAVAALKIEQGSVDFLKSRLIEMANGRKSAGGGVLVYPMKGRTTTDYKKVIKDNCPDVDLESYSKTGGPTWAVRSET